MNKKSHHPPQAHLNQTFIKSSGARSLRIMAEYIEPEQRFEKHDIRDTIVFFGSARTPSRETALAELEAAKAEGGDVAAAELRLEMSRYYEDTRELARRLTEWSKALEGTDRRFVICTGGGPGIMEAANRGACEAKGLSVGLYIELPFEATGNPYITPDLTFEFHYFFMLKFWFTYLSKAMVAMPGGFGTFDELFEVLTLLQTRKMVKHQPILLFGKEYWDSVVDFDALVRAGTISAGDLEFIHHTDSVDDAFDFITRELTEFALADPGGGLS